MVLFYDLNKALGNINSKRTKIEIIDVAHVFRVEYFWKTLIQISNSYIIS